MSINVFLIVGLLYEINQNCYYFQETREGL